MEDPLRKAYDHVLQEFGSKDADFWQARIGKDAIEIGHPGDPNSVIEIEPMWNSKKERGCEIRVLISIFQLKSKRFRTNVPTASFVFFEDNRIREFQNPSGSEGTSSRVSAMFWNSFR